MGNVRGNEGNIAGSKGKRMAVDREVDRAAEDDGDLLFGMAVDRKDGARLVDVPNQRLVGAMDSLPRNAVERMLARDRVPIDGSRLVGA